jgi:uncharacterized protein
MGGKRVLPVIVFFILLFVFAKWGPAINLSTITQTKGEPFVVTGEGKTSVTPDIARVTLGIEGSGASLKTVQDSVNKKSKALTDAVKKLGIDEKDIKTISYYVYPQYDWNGPTQRITGYQVSTDYRITIKDFDEVNDVIAAGVGAGANVVGNVSFDLNEETETEKTNEARALAVKAAKAKAEGLAKAAGITLGKIINVSENQNGGVRLMALPVSGGGEMDKSATQANIQPGTTEINITVSLSYEVR